MLSKKITNIQQTCEILELHIVLFHIVWHIRTNTTDHIANVDGIIGVFSTMAQDEFNTFPQKKS